MDNNIEFNDIPVSNISDFQSDKSKRFYPYELPNISNKSNFIENMGYTLAYISNKSFIDKKGFLLDENGIPYFECYTDISGQTKLNRSNSYPLITTLKSAKSGDVVTNVSFKNDKKPNSDFPIILTIDKPLNIADYDDGIQDVYFAETTSKGKLTSDNEFVLDPEGLTVLKIEDVNVLLSNYNGATLSFTSTFDTINTPIIQSNQKSNQTIKSGVTLEFENHTLLHSFHGKGETSEFKDGKKQPSEFGDINFISNDKMIPIIASPQNIKNKVEMYFNWWDYQSALPFSIINLFNKGATLRVRVDGTTSSSAPRVLIEDDVKLIEDMLVITAGSADSWADAPLVESVGDIGKIDPKFRVGWNGIKVQSLMNKDAIKIVDGLWENHIRKHSSLLTNLERLLPLTGIINALSRYISASKAIGKGNNSFNNIYLPWFLEPMANYKIKYTEKKTIPNPDTGKTGDVDTYVISSDVKFQSRSMYFRDNFTSPLTLLPSLPGVEFTLPSSINFSNTILVQTPESKLTLPLLPEVLSPIDKIMNPGDVNTRSLNELKYLFYIPNSDKWQELMLDKFTKVSPSKKGEEININIPNGSLGKIWTDEDVKDYIKVHYPGATIKVSPQITQVPGIELNITDFYREIDLLPLTLIGRIPSGDPVPDKILQEKIATKFGYEDFGSVVITDNSSKFHDPIIAQGQPAKITGYIKYQVTHSEFGAGTIISAGSTPLPYSHSERQVLFDKQAYKRFLFKFNISPYATHFVNLSDEDDYRITRLNKLILGTLWGNYVNLWIGGMMIKRIPLLNADDESITIQKIIFS